MKVPHNQWKPMLATQETRDALTYLKIFNKFISANKDQISILGKLVNTQEEEKSKRLLKKTAKELSDGLLKQQLNEYLDAKNTEMRERDAIKIVLKAHDDLINNMTDIDEFIKSKEIEMKLFDKLFFPKQRIPGIQEAQFNSTAQKKQEEKKETKKVWEIYKDRGTNNSGQIEATIQIGANGTVDPYSNNTIPLLQKVQNDKKETSNKESTPVPKYTTSMSTTATKQKLENQMHPIAKNDIATHIIKETNYSFNIANNSIANNTTLKQGSHSCAICKKWHINKASITAFDLHVGCRNAPHYADIKCILEYVEINKAAQSYRDLQCQTCKNYIHPAIKECVPEIKGVYSVLETINIKDSMDLKPLYPIPIPFISNSTCKDAVECIYEEGSKFHESDMIVICKNKHFAQAGKLIESWRKEVSEGEGKMKYSDMVCGNCNESMSISFEDKPMLLELKNKSFSLPK